MIAVATLTCLAGCGSDHSAELAELEQQVARMSARIDELEAERADPALTPEVNAEPVEKLELRELSIVDESGVPRIRLRAGDSGSQIWLADHEQKRILLTAMKPVDVAGDVTGVVVQGSGQAILWQTPPVK